MVMRTYRIATPLLALLLVFSLIALPVSAQSTSGERLIQTRGTGEVTTAPDRVELSFAVVTEHQDVRRAQTENSVRMNGVMDALKRSGLTSDDLKTTGSSIRQVTRDSDQRLQLDRQTTIYRVTNTLLVTMDDTTRAGEIIDRAIDNGANSVNYISFTLSDELQKSLRAEALELAVAESRTDADIVAAALGLSVRDVKEVSIDAGYSPMTRSMYDMAMPAAGMEKLETPIEAGDITVTATVSISYII